MFLAVTPREIVRQLARGSGLTILIKVANAFLAYAMLLIIARVTTTEHYGIFAVAFSVSMSASYIAALGQPWAINRYWPQWMAQNQPLKAKAFLRLSLLVTAVGMGIAMALSIMGGALSMFGAMPWTLPVAVATGVFALALGWADFASSSLRAQGHIVIALLPRDIGWRLGACAVFGAGALADWTFRAEFVVASLGGILLVMICPQIVMLLRSCKSDGGAPLSSEDRRGITRYSTIMWASTVADLAKNYAAVLIVSAYLGVESAGAYFAAERTANVLSFLLLAITIVSTPQISHYYHSDRKELVRIIVGFCGLAAGLTALAGLVFFFLFGAEILSLFKPAYADYLPVLLILCCGQFFAAAAGPVGPLLRMSGSERIDFILIVSVGCASVVAQVVAGLYWGAIGVALGAAGGSAAVSLIAVTYAWFKLRMDPTGFTLAVEGFRRLANVFAPR